MKQRRITKIAAVILSAIMVLMFTGCAMIVDITTNVSKKGSGTVAITVGFDEEFWGMISSDMDDEEKKEFQEIEYDGEKIYGATESESFNSYEELNKLMTNGNPVQDAMSNLGETEETADEPGLFTSFEASKSGIKAVIDAEAMGMEDMDSMKEAGVIFKFPLKFTFEDEVVEANGKISEDKHTVTYDLLTDREINITLKNKSTSPVLIIVILAIIAAVVFFIVKSNKKKAAEAEALAEAEAAEALAEAAKEDVEEDAAVIDAVADEVIEEAAEAETAVEAVEEAVEEVPAEAVVEAVEEAAIEAPAAPTEEA